MNASCIRCKGNGHCGRSYCPHILKGNAMFKLKDSLKSSEFSSAAPAPFVGNYGYPNVRVGILAPPEKKDDAWLYDAPRHWAKENYRIPQIVDFRSSLINSRFKSNVRQQSKMLELSQEVGMASKPVDMEIGLKDKPRFRMNSNDVTAPMGPGAELEKAEITSNTKIHTKVEKAVSDTDLKASTALVRLYESEFDENFLTKVFTVGNLGLKKNRRLVPTRWSITAVDDTLGISLRKKIRDEKAINDYLVYFGDYLGNYYLVLMIPDVWGYELFETYMPNASWNTSGHMDYTTDLERFNGRNAYAENCAGGYYSVRLAVLEKLRAMKRQATAVVIRVITGEYTAPLGVWVTREAARKALSGKPLMFESQELMVKYAEAFLKKRFGIIDIIAKSALLKDAKAQTRLGSFF